MECTRSRRIDGCCYVSTENSIAANLLLLCSLLSTNRTTERIANTRKQKKKTRKINSRDSQVIICNTALPTSTEYIYIGIVSYTEHVSKVIELVSPIHHHRWEFVHGNAVPSMNTALFNAFLLLLLLLLATSEQKLIPYNTSRVSLDTVFFSLSYFFVQ